MVEDFDVIVVGLGALGSATAMELAARGHRVLGLERFAFGHSRGASHDTSRILRHSYHTPTYVRLTQHAYADWARLEEASSQTLVTTVGGLDIFPSGAAIRPAEYVQSLAEVGIDFEVLDASAVQLRWPQFALPAGCSAIYQRDGAIVPAALGTQVMQQQARAHGAVLRQETPVRAARPRGAGVEIETAHGRARAAGLVVCADAWVNDLLADFDAHVPVEVTLEQVTYFRPEDPAAFDGAVLPLWIWMDDPSFYGFPTYGVPLVKAAQDCGGPSVDPDRRTDQPDPGMQALLAAHLARLLPGSGPAVRSLRCQYTLTPDRDFVVAPVPEHPQVVVGLGAAHGFKFAPTFGKMLADLVSEGSTGFDVSDFRLDRPGLTDPEYAARWLV